MGWIRAVFASPWLRLCIVLWCFGYLLVDLGALLQGRSAPGVMLLVNLPLLALGVAQSVGLSRLLGQAGRWPAFLVWPAVAVGAALAGAVQTLADHYWLKMLALTLFPSWQDWALSVSVSRLATIYLLYTWTFGLSAALIWSVRASDVARLNEARAAAFEAAASKAEAAALRLQLNPHFLFNTLNGIASLVVTGKQAQAEEMIGRLADFLRSSLAADPTALIPLSQELATVRSYLNIEEARFGDRMQVLYRFDEALLDLPVPNFILQPLIENAVKYGVAPSRRRTTIELAGSCDGRVLFLSVENRESGEEVPGFADTLPPGTCTGLGLANTRRRLESLYGEAAWVRTRALGKAYRSEIALPLPAERIQPVAAE